MKPPIFTARAARWLCTCLWCCLLLVISLTAAKSQQFANQPFMMPEQKAPAATAKLAIEPGAVEVAFTDGSNLKMLLREEKIALATPYGKLLIAVADIQRIEFATRVSEEDAKRIRTAITDLGSAEFGKREAASAQLLKLREKGYPDIVRAAGSKDLEVTRRAKELVQQISASVSAEQLAVRPKDVVYTADSMIAGRIEAVSLKAHTSQFGDVQLRLADARSLRSQALEAEANAVSQSSRFIPAFPPGMGMGGIGGLGGIGGMRPQGGFQGNFQGMNPMGRNRPMPK